MFTAGERQFRWADVVAAARAWSSWGELERRAEEAIAVEESEADPQLLEIAQNEFRYQRNLLAADDLEEWLDNWGVTIDDWLLQVRGTVPRQEASSPSPALDVDPERLADATWAEAVCSGELDRLARKLAERCAGYEATGKILPPDLDDEILADLEQQYRHFRQAAVTDVALERKLQDESIDWTRIEGRYLAHESEDVVRETVIAVREDGLALEEAARLAGARFEPAAVFYLADLEAELKTRLLTAAPGELCGPVRVAEERWLVEVGARVPPSLDDEAIRARAATAVADRAVEREVLGRVRWHVQASAA